MHSYHLNVFDLVVAFRTEADAERVEKARSHAEELYQTLKFRGSHLGRDRLLTILVLGITDDLLQLRQQMAEQEKRLRVLLQRIEDQKRSGEESDPGTQVQLPVVCRSDQDHGGVEGQSVPVGFMLSDPSD